MILTRQLLDTLELINEEAILYPSLPIVNLCNVTGLGIAITAGHSRRASALFYQCGSDSCVVCV